MFHIREQKNVTGESNMRAVKDMPEGRQFVAVWEYNGEIWSGIHKVKGGVLLDWNHGLDMWKPSPEKNLGLFKDRTLDAVYFVYGDE